MINSEKENKKAAADALRTGDSLQPHHIYIYIYMYRIIRYFVWYILSLTMKACAMDTTQANTISPIIIIIFFPFLILMLCFPTCVLHSI